jgi:hypothetical protein
MAEELTTDPFQSRLLHSRKIRRKASVQQPYAQRYKETPDPAQDRAALLKRPASMPFPCLALDAADCCPAVFILNPEIHQPFPKVIVRI